ncbi:MAG: hypothetical protein OXH28_10985 [bacterium]|nr:hypothetical protein [bacterium]
MSRPSTTADRRDRPVTAAVQLWLIAHPINHRHAEAAWLVAARAATPPELAPFFAEVPTPAAADDWACDVCSARIDPHAPIIAAGTVGPSYALCRSCLAGVVDNWPDAAQRHRGYIPVSLCPCTGCQNAAAPPVPEANGS